MNVLQLLVRILIDALREHSLVVQLVDDDSNIGDDDKVNDDDNKIPP